jgi:glutaminyl-peptide cyclotransferase
VLVIALIVQLALGAGLIVVAVNGFPLIGGSDEAHRAIAAPGAVPRATVDRFDAPHAFALIGRQLGYGQRPAGSPALRRLAEVLRRQLPSGRFEAVRGDPGLRNIVGTLPGRRPAIVVGAHYDTEYHPKGFVGANDGAAGTAAVVELARALRSIGSHPTREVRFVLFDGEESPAGCSDFLTCGIRGSRAYANAHAHELRALVLADFVANRNLRLRRDLGSDAALWSRLRAAARRAGVGAIMSSSTQGTVEDDHTPFMKAGVPAIDLIDFDFPQWHTLQDRPAVLSKRSLDAAGEAVVELMRELRRR